MDSDTQSKSAPTASPAGLSPQEAQALAHPSRERIVNALARTPMGLTVAQLAELVDLHPNAIRQHLSVLAQVGVIAAAPTAPTGRRGRPSVRYLLSAPAGVSAVGHRELVRSLLGVIRRVGVDEAVIREIGREQGHDLNEITLGSDGPGGLDGLWAVLAGLGFAPQEVGTLANREAGKTEICLRSCPFQDAVLSPGGELICALHHGLVEGTLDRLNPEARLVEFEPHDPREGRCRIGVHHPTERSAADR